MTELAVILREPGVYTVFAPTDAAFAQMKAGMLEDLFEERENLSKVVKYHIVMGLYKAAKLLNVIFLKTMEGSGSPSIRQSLRDQVVRSWKTVRMPTVSSLKTRSHQPCWKAYRLMVRPSHKPM